MIGDPSGRSDMRTMMTKETIQHNVDCFKKQMSRFIDFSDGKALMVNQCGLAVEPELRGTVERRGSTFQCQPYADRRVLQAENGEGLKLS